MKANKRTVWFLTLLSLVAVISIYYLRNEQPMSLDGMAIFGDNDAVTVSTPGETESKTKTVYADSMLFEEMRMQVQNERSTLKDQLTSKVLSPDTTAEEKSAAYDEMAELTKRSSAEALMETQLKALGYPEAFVRKDDGKVTVSVISEDGGHSTKMAAEITQYVLTSWEDARTVQVVFMER
ncbi:SpoIIIAH-like family protein [Sporosarcina sp. ACRSL]|uniref:SpoIIIAH-like family protein n=1 Tax=Sporosarcina sp. ACRSL TaxID=2918215 RepID=UPI001EF6A019|nr:SpoIIIAH-like family protein [Sporosarcina sp. ACRSL]MCG7345164.1 SpoIIIAH-like family protein [Sporosarcina sp. ACRSL]